MTPSMLKAKKRLEAALEAFKKITRTSQKRCKHKKLARCDSYVRGYATFPPSRVCLSCGMTEDGWGCGYLVLKGDDKNIPLIPREELYALREGLMIQDYHKSSLLRREATVAELIDGKDVRDASDD